MRIKYSDEIWFDVGYTYTPEIPGVYDKAPEDCYETEPSEVEIEEVLFKNTNILELLNDDTLNYIERVIRVKEGG